MKRGSKEGIVASWSQSPRTGDQSFLYEGSERLYDRLAKHIGTLKGVWPTAIFITLRPASPAGGHFGGNELLIGQLGEPPCSHGCVSFNRVGCNIDGPLPLENAD